MRTVYILINEAMPECVFKESGFTAEKLKSALAEGWKK
jgi:hypothetical protein